ncbi:MAG: hypothetical protein J7M08_09475, partial [Planctomycetes bacterium]|nr:hypothetical protein [Planctomycetota bacterium]
MTMRVAIYSCVALFLLIPGCAGGRSGPPPAGGPPEVRPVIDLAGQSRAFRAPGPLSLPTGPGAEGAPGDLVLENAFVKFVVASATRPEGGCPAGQLLDAVVQGGPDRLRRLEVMAQTDVLRSPCYDEVRIEKKGGPG